MTALITLSGDTVKLRSALKSRSRNYSAREPPMVDP
jgi:hypothetical protein